MKHQISKALRHIVFERDSYTCALCSNPATDLHHLRPRSQGGHDMPHNLISVCRRCHLMLHRQPCAGDDRLPDVWLWEIATYLADCYADDVDTFLFAIGNLPDPPIAP